MDESYRRLCVDRIQQTNRILCARIHERFPTARLGRVCEDLNCLIDATARRASVLRQLQARKPASPQTFLL